MIGLQANNGSIVLGIINMRLVIVFSQNQLIRLSSSRLAPYHATLLRVVCARACQESLSCDLSLLGGYRIHPY